MVFINGLLTFMLVLDCLLLIFLVLIQLPKKEAGAGLAFGGAATDALFGAGSGTVLTKVTKYAATTFFGLVIVIAVFQTHFLGQRSGSDFGRRLREAGQAQSTTPQSSPSSPIASATATNTSTDSGLLSSPTVTSATAEATNTPAPAVATPASAVTNTVPAQ